MKAILRTIGLGGAAALLVASAGCSNPELADAPPPVDAPEISQEPSYTPPPPPRHIETTELLGGPDEADPPQDFIAMAPIPNPEDLSPEEREEIYGRAHAEGVAAAATPRARARSPQRQRAGRHAAPTRQARARHGRSSYVSARHGHRHAAARGSTANARHASRRAPARHRAAAPTHRAPAHSSKPVHAVIRPSAPSQAALVQPSAPQQAAPSTSIAKAAPAAPAPTGGLNKTELLGGAVGPDVTSGAKFVVPAELGQGRQAVASLTLPASLADRIRAEAAKLGLVREARTVDARATLTGDGYAIIPSASQSARLREGEATTFNWQVTPKPGAKGALKAEVGGELKGGAVAQPFPITTLEQTPPAPAAEAAKPDNAPAANAAAKAPRDNSAGDTLFSAGKGPKPWVIAVLAAFALVILFAAANSAAARRRASERRRQVAMGQFGEQSYSDLRPSAPARDHRHDEHA